MAVEPQSIKLKSYPLVVLRAGAARPCPVELELSSYLPCVLISSVNCRTAAVNDYHSPRYSEYPLAYWLL